MANPSELSYSKWLTEFAVPLPDLGQIQPQLQVEPLSPSLYPSDAKVSSDITKPSLPTERWSRELGRNSSSWKGYNSLMGSLSLLLQ